MVSPPKSRDICVPASKFHPMHRTRSISWGHVPLDCQEFVMRTLSLIPWTMAYHQVRGRAASLSPKSRPKVHLPVLRARARPDSHGDLRTKASGASGCTGLTGALRGVEQGAAIGFSMGASVFSHRLPSLRTHAPSRSPGSLFSRVICTVPVHHPRQGVVRGW